MKGLKFKLLKNFNEVLQYFVSTVIFKASQWSREQVEDQSNILDEQGTTRP